MNTAFEPTTLVMTRCINCDYAEPSSCHTGIWCGLYNKRYDDHHKCRRFRPIPFKPTEPPGHTDIPDQNIKADAGKAQLRLVPFKIIYDIARIREYGNNKYGDSESWRRVDPERYIDAMLRHALAFAEDPKSVDEESKLPHLWHLACNIAFLSEMFKDQWKE